MGRYFERKVGNRKENGYQLRTTRSYIRENGKENGYQLRATRSYIRENERCQETFFDVIPVVRKTCQYLICDLGPVIRVFSAFLAGFS